MRTSINLITIFVVSIIIGAIAFSIAGYGHVTEVKAKVEGKERITESVGDRIESFYLVYTDKGTFKLEDDLFRGQWPTERYLSQRSAQSQDQTKLRLTLRSHSQSPPLWYPWSGQGRGPHQQRAGQTDD